MPTHPLWTTAAFWTNTNRAKSSSASPQLSVQGQASLAPRASGRMTGLLSRGAAIQRQESHEGLVRQAPVEHSKLVSQHCALQSDDIRDSKFPALSPSGQLGFTGSRRLLVGVKHRAYLESAQTNAIQQNGQPFLTTDPDYPHQGHSWRYRTWSRETRSFFMGVEASE